MVAIRRWFVFRHLASLDSTTRARALAVAQKIEAQASENLIQPGIKRPVGIDRVARSGGAGARLLRQVERVLARLDQPYGLSVRAPHVPLDQTAEFVRVARLGADHERSVGVGVHAGCTCYYTSP
jgi:hypothetical protein